MCSDLTNSIHTFSHRENIDILVSPSRRSLTNFLRSTLAPLLPRSTIVLCLLAIDRWVKRRWDSIRSELAGRMLINDFTSRYARTERGQRRYCIIICSVHPRGARVSDGAVCSRRAFTRTNANKGYARCGFVCGIRRSVSVITYQINYSYYFIPPRRFRTSCRAELARYFAILRPERKAMRRKARDVKCVRGKTNSTEKKL